MFCYLSKICHYEMIIILMRLSFAHVSSCCCWNLEKILCLYLEYANIFKKLTTFGTFGLVNCFWLMNTRACINYNVHHQQNFTIWIYLFKCRYYLMSWIDWDGFSCEDFSTIQTLSEVCYEPVNALLLEMHTAKILWICHILHSHWNLMKDVNVGLFKN